MRTAMFSTQRGRRRRAAAAALAATALLSTAACGSGEPTASGEDGPYRVGLLLGLTGVYATLGEAERTAAELYVDRLNESGGIDGGDVELVVADTTSVETEAVNQFRRLATQENVVAVLGPSSTGESIAVKPLANSLKVPLLSLASSVAIVTPPAESQWVFKAFAGSDASLRAQLEHVKNEGKRKVAILASNNAYGQEPAGSLERIAGEYGLEVVGSELFAPTATDTTPQLSALAEGRPDATLVWAVNPANAVVAKNAAAINYPGLLLHSPGGASPQYIELAGAAAEGTLVQGSKVAAASEVAADDPQQPAIKELTDAWATTQKGTPNQFAAIGWDAMTVLETALSKAGGGDGSVQGTRQALRDSLEANIKDLPLTNVVFDFSADQHGPDSTEGLAILVVRNGKFSLA